MSIPTKQDIIVALKADDIFEALDRLYEPMCGDRYGAWDGGAIREDYLCFIGGEDYVDFAIRIEDGEPVIPAHRDHRGLAVVVGFDAVAQWMRDRWPTTVPPRTLGALLLALQDGTDYLREDLLTFGGTPIWSWNETQFLIGEDLATLRIIDRDD